MSFNFNKILKICFLATLCKINAADQLPVPVFPVMNPTQIYPMYPAAMNPIQMYPMYPAAMNPMQMYPMINPTAMNPMQMYPLMNPNGMCFTPMYFIPMPQHPQTIPQSATKSTEIMPLQEFHNRLTAFLNQKIRLTSDLTEGRRINIRKNIIDIISAVQPEHRRIFVETFEALTKVPLMKITEYLIIIEQLSKVSHEKLNQAIVYGIEILIDKPLKLWSRQLILKFLLELPPEKLSVRFFSVLGIFIKQDMSDEYFKRSIDFIFSIPDNLLTAHLTSAVINSISREMMTPDMMPSHAIIEVINSELNRLYNGRNFYQ
ncbi:MAG: hypothetical protein KBD31_05480 [Proteobacteria bacterium]|nr:hypothetical protein [Pseudomonadota bacterium]